MRIWMKNSRTEEKKVGKCSLGRPETQARAQRLIEDRKLEQAGDQQLIEDRKTEQRASLS